jgi:hypothetical protein
LSYVTLTAMLEPYQHNVSGSPRKRTLHDLRVNEHTP